MRGAPLVALSVVVLATLPVTLALLANGAPGPLLFAWVVLMDVGVKLGLLVLVWRPEPPRAQRHRTNPEPHGRPEG